MRITPKQLQEIDFLEKHYVNSETTQEERENYIKQSVLGKGSFDIRDETNRLMQAKRRLDIDIKMWRKDLSEGYFSVDEFINDFNHPYATKLFKTILKSLKFDYTKGEPIFHLYNMIKAKE